VNKVLISNFSEATNIADIAGLFADFGEIVAIAMYEGKFGPFAIVEMSWVALVDEAVESLDGRDLDGQTLKVKKARW
jgi:hypothetical protein